MPRSAFLRTAPPEGARADGTGRRGAWHGASPMLLMALLVASLVHVTPARADVVNLTTPTFQWQLAAIDARRAWSVTKGEGVVVAVIDTGVDGSHPEFRGRMVVGFDALTDRVLARYADSDEVGHGTHVAGIIAAADDGTGITGVAPRSLIMAVRVLGPRGGSDDDVVQGIKWAVDNGAEVMNLSLGSSSNNQVQASGIICDAIEYAVEHDVVVLASAGNEGGSLSNPLNIPAACDGTLSVSALDEQLELSSFSSFDSTVRIAAPGTRIYSTVPRTKAAELGAVHGYADMRGTSMASPVVAGVAALVRSAFPRLSQNEVVHRLLSRTVDVEAPGFDPFTGHGLVNAASAVIEDIYTQSTSEIREQLGSFAAPSFVTSYNSGDLIVSHTGLRGFLAVGYIVEVWDYRNQRMLVSRDLDIRTVRTLFQGISDGVYLVRVSVRNNAGVVPGNWNMVETPMWLTGGASADYSVTYDSAPNYAPTSIETFTSQWTSAGIKVTLKFNRSTEFNVDAAFGTTEVRSFSAFEPTNATALLISVKETEYVLRALPVTLVLTYSPYGDTKTLNLQPALPISVRAVRLGSSQLAIYGEASRVCSPCRTARVTIRLGAKSVQVPVADDGTFYVTVPRKGITTVRASLGVHYSAPLRLGQ